MNLGYANFYYNNNKKDSWVFENFETKENRKCQCIERTGRMAGRSFLKTDWHDQRGYLLISSCKVRCSSERVIEEFIRLIYYFFHQLVYDDWCVVGKSSGRWGGFSIRCVRREVVINLLVE